MRGEAQLGRYYAYVLFFIGAMVGLVLSSNLLLVFVFWEITALCSYAFISFHNDDPKAVAGGIKALIITQVGGIGLLAGAPSASRYRTGRPAASSTWSNHAAMKGLAFLAAGSLLYALHLAHGSHQPLMLDDLNGAAQRYPLTAFALSVAVLALGACLRMSTRPRTRWASRSWQA